MNYSGWLLAMMLPFFYSGAVAQGYGPVFSHLTTSNGLSQNSVFAIIKDYKGFMWFATDEGLNKYDGYQFTTYKHDPANKQSISNNSIYDIKEDSAHNLWVVTAGGLDRFDRARESFTHFTLPDKSAMIKNICLDRKQQLWLSTTGGVVLFDAGTSTFKFFTNKPGDSNTLSNNFVYRILEDEDGKLWVGTRNGLNRFNPLTHQFEHFFHQPGNRSSIGEGYIKALWKDRKGNIWIGTQGSGIARYQRNNNTFINYSYQAGRKDWINHNDILSFTESLNGDLWIGTENGGINIFDKVNNRFVHYQNNEFDPSSISGNSIHSLYRDDIGNIWAGTWSNGINFFPVHGKKFKHFQHIPDNNNSLSNDLVLSISSDEEQKIWIGTDGGGLNRFDPLTRRFTRYNANNPAATHLFNNYVVTVSEFRKEEVIAGFHRGGIDIFNTVTGHFKHYAPPAVNPNRLSAPSINVVYKDRQQNVWLGCSDNVGIYLFDVNSHHFLNYAPNDRVGNTINGGRVFVMYETRAGNFYIGGDKGLDLFDRKTGIFTHQQHQPGNAQSISNDMVYSISEDSTGNLWIGTAGGLNYFNIKLGTFMCYNEKDGLPNNTVWGILQDRHGNLWISTNKGISRFNPYTKKFRNYTTSDGLQDNAFKLGAAYQLPSGEMFFGGVNGFNAFHPDGIIDNTMIPPVYLTGLSIFNKPVVVGNKGPLNKSINEIDGITLAYNQSVFTVEFAALNFTHPENNNYAYLLEGFEKEWNYVGNKRSATYTNLYPGTYIFKVKASNNDGVWNETATQLIITVIPPFWLTWWFVMLLALLIIGAVAALYGYRVNVIQQQKVLLQQQVDVQTRQLVLSNKVERAARLEAEQARLDSDEARQQLFRTNETLLVKNKELEQFAFVASHDLQEPLRTTTGFVHLLQQQYQGRLDERADKYLAFILSASTRMKTLICDLLDFSKIGNKAALELVDCNAVVQNVLMDIQVAITESAAEIKVDELPLLPGYPTEIKLLFQNLLLNAIKFRKKTVAPVITISARHIDGYWEFAVSDNGIGIAPQYNEKIFDIFQRLHTRNEYDGSGIGLSHCKKIVSLHHGKIHVTSTLGVGSTFYFTLFIHPNQPLTDPGNAIQTNENSL